MNQYKIVISGDKNKPKFLNLKCPEPNCVNLGFNLFNVCSSAKFGELLREHKIFPLTKGVKDRITILISFASESTKSITSITIRCPHQSKVFDNKKFLSQFSKLLG